MSVQTEVVKMNDQGRLTIPKSVRQFIGAEGGANIVFEPTADGKFLICTLQPHDDQAWVTQEVVEMIEEAAREEGMQFSTDEAMFAELDS